MNWRVIAQAVLLGSALAVPDSWDGSAARRTEETKARLQQEAAKLREELAELKSEMAKQDAGEKEQPKVAHHHRHHSHKKSGHHHHKKSGRVTESIADAAVLSKKSGHSHHKVHWGLEKPEPEEEMIQSPPHPEYVPTTPEPLQHRSHEASTHLHGDTGASLHKTGVSHKVVQAAAASGASNSVASHVSAGATATNTATSAQVRASGAATSSHVAASRRKSVTPAPSHWVTESPKRGEIEDEERAAEGNKQIHPNQDLKDEEAGGKIALNQAKYDESPSKMETEGDAPAPVGGSNVISDTAIVGSKKMSAQREADDDDEPEELAELTSTTAKMQALASSTTSAPGSTTLGVIGGFHVPKVAEIQQKESPVGEDESPTHGKGHLVADEIQEEQRRLKNKHHKHRQTTTEAPAASVADETVDASHEIRVAPDAKHIDLDYLLKLKQKFEVLKEEETHLKAMESKVDILMKNKQEEMMKEMESKLAELKDLKGFEEASRDTPRKHIMRKADTI